MPQPRRARTFGFMSALLLVLSSGVAWAAEEPAARGLMNFETEQTGAILARSADGKPWRRFGNATNDHLQVTGKAERVLAGQRSAQFGLRWPAKFAAVRCTLETPLNLTDHAAITMLVRSELPHTTTTVNLTLGDGATTYALRTPLPLQPGVNRLVFPLDPQQWQRTDGRGAATDVWRQVSEIGLTFQRQPEDAAAATETLIFDDVTLWRTAPPAEGKAAP